MHTVEMLAQSLELFRRAGYQIREEWLAGSGGGCCELSGKKIFFVDLALSPSEQLEIALEALREQKDLNGLMVPGQLQDLVLPKKSA